MNAKKTLDTIIIEKTESIKNRILLHLSTNCYIIDVSNKVNKNISVIFVELIGI